MSRLFRILSLLLAALVLSAAQGGIAQAQTWSPSLPSSLIRPSEPTVGLVRVAYTSVRATELFASAPSSYAKSVRFVAVEPGITVEESARRWRTRPGVVSARPVVYRQPQGDPLWPYQWDLGSWSAASSRAEGAWSTTTGSSDVVVAVVDTGRTNHPDLLPAMPAGWGYDMIAYPLNGDDGDGRDPDPTDEGDWGFGAPSSWHGTHVAGTIAAQHNDIGVRGIAPGIKLMHVRVCGYLGCDDVDIVDAIRWSAGLATDIDGFPWSASGIPVNEHPADVINLSLGGSGNCASPSNLPYRTAISEAREAGTVIVVAAGNDGQNAQGFTPASCRDAVTVAATGANGGRASYSNFGALVDLAAPGGDSRIGPTILSTIDLGTTIQSAYGYGYMEGTSMATPHVTGAVALLRSVWPNSTAAEVENELRLTARTFPSRCRDCGAGLLDIAALVSRTPQSELSIDNDPALKFGVGVTTTLSAVGGSGTGAITAATTTPSVCSVSGASVTGLRVGTCTITITKARTSTYFPATSAPLSVSVVTPHAVLSTPAISLSFDKSTASVTDGTWNASGSFAYTWYRCKNATRQNTCTVIPSVITNSYTVQRPLDVGWFLRAQVTLTVDGLSVSAWSNATPKIAR